MRIYAIGNTYGKLPDIPKEYQNKNTLLVLVGNNCPDFKEDWQYERRVLDQPAEIVGPRGFWNFIRVDQDSTAKRQLEWVRRTLVPYLLKFKLNTQRVVWVGGPRDFCAVQEIFPLSVFRGARSVQCDGVEIALLSGSPKIAGEWSDEIEETEFKQRIETLPKTAQIMISHTPGYAILDKNLDEESLGSLEITHGVSGEWGLGFPHFTKLTLHIHSGPEFSAGEWSQEIKRSGSILSQRFTFDHTLRFFNVAGLGQGVEFEK